MVSTRWRWSTSWIWWRLVQSRNSNGPASHVDPRGGMRMSDAITWSPPYRARRAATSSEPICPSAPVTRMFSMRGRILQREAHGQRKRAHAIDRQIAVGTDDELVRRAVVEPDEAAHARRAAAGEVGQCIVALGGD